MQLKKKIVSSLAVATCSLLNANSAPSIAQDASKDWNLEAALLYYGEQSRVNDFSANLLFRRAFDRDRYLSLTASYDTLTGASANGALAASTPQTFTGASGAGGYSTPAGKLPLDPTFHDTRFAFAGDWDQPIGMKSRLDTGFSFSSEVDYLHTGANGTYTRDFNGHNTSFNLGMAFSWDTVTPIGGPPDPFSEMMPTPRGNENEGEGEGEGGGGGVGKSKNVTDLLVGVTQVFGPRTIGQLSYSYSRSAGYLNDPYKILSVIDPATGNPVPVAGRLNLYLFESRPDSRSKQSLFGQIKRSLGRDDVVDLSYRYMVDDWGIVSHTIDFHYRWQFANWYVRPHIRYYTQGAADFYVTGLLDGKPLPNHASADYRLGLLDATTLGLKYGRPQADGREWAIRIEYYNQSGKSPPSEAGSPLAALYQDPSLDAVIFQVGYTF